MFVKNMKVWTSTRPTPVYIAECTPNGDIKCKSANPKINQQDEMVKSCDIFSFLKFGTYEHMVDLYENGTIYMNSIQFFRTFEDEKLRSDKFEGASSIRNLPSGTFEIKELNYAGEYISIQLFESYKEVLGNIYSMYCISSYHISDPIEFKVDSRNLAFGEACVMIENNPEFLRRITDKLEELGLKSRHDLVDYYDVNTKNGRLTLFDKPKEYEFQNEFRFYVERDSIEPLVIQIGSLRDIAKLHSTRNIIDGLALTHKEEIDNIR
jgi:hypothetical protein